MLQSCDKVVGSASMRFNRQCRERKGCHTVRLSLIFRHRSGNDDFNADPVKISRESLASATHLRSYHGCKSRDMAGQLEVRKLKVQRFQLGKLDRKSRNLLCQPFIGCIGPKAENCGSVPPQLLVVSPSQVQLSELIQQTLNSTTNVLVSITFRFMLHFPFFRS